MNKTILTILGACCTAAATGNGQSFTYDFPGADPVGDGTVPSIANITFNAFTRLNVTTSTAADVFSSSNWNLGGSQDTTEYVSFTFKANSGFSLSLTSLSFDINRSATGPVNGTVEVLRGGTSLETRSTYSIGTSVASVSFDFADFSATDTQQVEFRFYGWSAGGTGGTMRLDNVSGSVTVVPEPHEYAIMIGLGLCGYAAYRRRAIKLI